MISNKRALLGYGLTIAYVCVAVLAVTRDLRPPAGVDALGGITPAAIKNHVKVIAREPHPTGTVANERVRRYIVEQLRAMGVAHESTPRFIARSGFLNIHVGARVRNVVARIKGKPGKNTLLVMAHYDSRPFAPGANDDGAAVASMLETIRAVKNGPTPRNNIIFLFTDGEELGLLGARAFIREHRYAKDVDLVLNFEGRGRTGPTILFETSGGDEALVRAFAADVPNPVGTSLAASVYRLMPNDTDFSPFRKLGIPGLNFAYLGDVSAYHSMLDTHDSLDEATLRHQAQIMSRLTRSFAREFPSAATESSATFFNLDALMIRYPNLVGRILAGVACVAWMLCVAYGWRRRVIELRAVGRGMLFTLGGMVGAVVLVLLLRWVVNLLHPGFAFMPNGDTYNVIWYRIAYTLSAVLVMIWLYGRYRGHGGMAGVLLGGMGWWALFTLLSAVFLPGAAFFFTWPLLICCGFLIAAAYQEERQMATVTTLIAYGLFTAVWVYFAGGILLTAMEGLTLRAIAFVMPVVAMAMVPLFPMLDIFRLLLRPVILTGLCGVMACLAAASIFSKFDAAHPRPDSIIFAHSVSDGRTAWITCDPASDAWTSHFLGKDPKTGHVKEFLPVLKVCPGSMGAPLRRETRARRKFRGPRARIIADKTRKGLRTVKVRLSSSRGARGLHAFINRQNAIIETVRVNGITTREKKTEDPKPGYTFVRRLIDFEQWESFLMYPGSSGSYTIEVSFRSAKPSSDARRPVLKLLVVDQSMGLGAAGVEIPNRPAHIMPASGRPLYDSVLVSRRYVFP